MDEEQRKTRIKELTEQRGRIKARVTRFTKFVRDNKANDDKVAEIKSRLSNIQPLFDQFEIIHGQIEDLKGHTDANELELFECDFFSVVGIATDIIDQKHCRTNAERVRNTTPSPMPQIILQTPEESVKLPDIDLPKFTGQYADWTSFYNTFQSLIDNDAKLTNVRKLHYLKGCVKGDAEQIISALALNDENYQRAWTLLKERYYNERLIVQSHINLIFNLPDLSKGQSTTLRTFTDQLISNLEALKTLKRPIEQWDDLLIYVIVSKFDFNTKRDWESTIKDKTSLPNMDQMKMFLKNRCNLLESISLNKQGTGNVPKNQGHNKEKSVDKRFTHVALAKGDKKCPVCDSPHPIYQCKDFLQLHVPNRIEEIRKLQLCTNCLRPNHKAAKCYSQSTCKHCSKNHNSLLHLSDEHKEADATKTFAGAAINGLNKQPQQTTETLLLTALILVMDRNHTYHQFRCLLDPGSQSSIISKDACRKLKLDTNKVNIPISGVSESETSAFETVSIHIKSKISSFSCGVDCLVLPKITAKLPIETFDKTLFKLPNNIQLADPTFNVSNDIDILLSVDVYFAILKHQTIKSNPNHPHLHDTEFGWIIGGRPTISHTQPAKTICNVTLNDLNRQILKFWEIENPIDRDSTITEEELACEQFFQDTFRRDENGKFIVRLPLRDNINQLGQNGISALKQFHSLERRLGAQPQLRTQYMEFMHEYEELNHMELVSRDLDLYLKDNTNNYFFPHHAVHKDSSQTTKLRVVFNGSSPTDKNMNLNDVLMTGPNIQQDIFSIVLRFRCHCYAITADIAKFYRQIWVDPSDRIFQHIFWRDEIHEPVQIYQLKTVTYGTSCASFLSARCLKQIAIDHLQDYPRASQVILNDFYVDDLLSGSDTLEEALILKHEVTSILQSAGFTLRKWASNDTSLMQMTNSNENIVNLDKNRDTKTLGLDWDYRTDTLTYNVDKMSIDDQITKRSILSKTSQLFDPLGLVGPIIVVPKIIMQKLWALKVDWDDPVPEVIINKWTEFVHSLNSLQALKIPRLVTSYSKTKSTNFQIHGFSDASENAYGCCLYLKSTSELDEVTVELLCSKSRVAPLKSQTIPRLELCASLLLAQLTDRVKTALSIVISKTYYWTDSKTVLTWLRSTPCTLKTFVGNRVSQIQSLTNVEDWRYVSTHDNPADLISRGTTVPQLIDSTIWWHGPVWLQYDHEQWPTNDKTTLTDVPDQKRLVLVSSRNDNISTLGVLTKFSRFLKLQRVIAYCLRLLYNHRNKESKLLGELSVNELCNAKRKIHRLVQLSAFSDEIESLQLLGRVGKRSKLLKLNPFLDQHGIIRVGGRLRNSRIINYDKRHPILLPSKHFLTMVIIRDVHIQTLHSGTQATLAAVREQYWPITGGVLTRKVIRSCVICFRAYPRPCSQMMGDLPHQRIEPHRPFLISGVDYCGPVRVREGRGRGKRAIKAYIALFICFITKAVHIELVLDCTTESFLAALNRFIARRGKPRDIFSDNGGNFVGADRELRNLIQSASFQSKIINFCTADSITWHFNPPRSPHWGGLWESHVKIVKKHLNKITRDSLLNYDEMYTLLTQIEAAVNSRPMTPLSNDPEDLQTLTPGHFLIGDRLTSTVEPDLTSIPKNRLSRWQYTQQLYQHFWHRWSQEYLTSLHQRVKWELPTPNVEVGSMVLLREENVHPMQWKIGRINRTFSGSDDRIRLVEVKTSSGVFKRAVQRICLLPINKAENTDFN